MTLSWSKNQNNFFVKSNFIFFTSKCFTKNRYQMKCFCPKTFWSKNRIKNWSLLIDLTSMTTKEGKTQNKRYYSPSLTWTNFQYKLRIQFSVWDFFSLMRFNSEQLSVSSQIRPCLNISPGSWWHLETLRKESRSCGKSLCSAGHSCQRSPSVWPATDGWTGRTSAPSAAGPSAGKSVKKIRVNMRSSAKYLRIKSSGKKIDF